MLISKDQRICVLTGDDVDFDHPLIRQSLIEAYALLLRKGLQSCPITSSGIAMEMAMPEEGAIR